MRILRSDDDFQFLFDRGAIAVLWVDWASVRLDLGERVVLVEDDGEVEVGTYTVHTLLPLTHDAVPSAKEPVAVVVSHPEVQPMTGPLALLDLGAPREATPAALHPEG